MRPLLCDICSARITRRGLRRFGFARTLRSGTNWLLLASVVRQDTVSSHAGFEPAAPPGTNRAVSIKANDLNYLLSVSFLSTFGWPYVLRHIQFFAVRAFRSGVPALKYFPVFPPQAKAHCSSYIFIITIVAVSAFASIEYHAGSAFSWKKSCELSLFRKSSQ